MTSNNYKYLLILYFVIYLTMISLFFGFNHPTWVDEGHFYRTIKLFATNFSIDTLRTYDEIISPFTFILYAIWAKIFNTELSTLRVFSLIIAFITYFRFFILAKKHLNDKWALILTIVLSLNPYMIGVSFFCYTDMLTILCSIELALAIHSNSLLRLVLFSTLSLYIRQYNITILIAIGIYYLITKKENRTINWRYAFSMFIPLIAFLPLIYLWKGIAPQSNMHSLLNGYEYHYQFTGLTTYIYTIFIYCLPFSIIWLYKNYNLKKWEILFCIIVSLIYYLYYHVTAAQCSIDQGSLTVGFFHKILTNVFKNNFLIHCGLYSSFLISSITLYNIFKKYILLYRSNIQNINLFYLINIFTFMLIIPFSFQIWEKYILVILPFLILLFTDYLQKKKFTSP